MQVRTTNLIFSQMVWKLRKNEPALSGTATHTLLQIAWSKDHVYQYKFSFICEIVINISEC